MTKYQPAFIKAGGMTFTGLVIALVGAIQGGVAVAIAGLVFAAIGGVALRALPKAEK